jgi:GNAT superfamily N-acetyltransferase
MVFATLDESHLSGALRLSAEARWPHRLEDWAFVAELSHGVVALEGDRVVATALATPFGPVGMVNLIIVDAAMRGQGVGREIMSRAMDTISPATWRLIATAEGLPLYEKLGFQRTGEILQHQGVVNALAPTGRAQWASDSDLAEMLALDSKTTGMDRSALYAALAQQARFAMLRDDTGITGFAAVRDFGRGEVAGPVIARSADDAIGLLSLVMSERRGKFLRIDSESGTGLGHWLVEQGLTQVDSGVLMQKGALPDTASASHTLFALASQALG